MLHPQARALLDLMLARQLPPTHTLSVADARAYYRERRHLTQPVPPAVGSVADMAADGPHGPVPVRHYRPLGAPAGAVLPALVFFHGGGWVIGDLDTHDTLCRELANGSGCAVVAVDYRMGPEHRFPTAVDDCIAATQWVRRHASDLRIDPARVAVGGDSAGGNLAAVVALALREEAPAGTSAPPLAFQLLIYPATDMLRRAPSHTSNAQGYLLTADTMRWFHDHYISDADDDIDWRASPLLHPDLRHAPPAFVMTAGYDPLRDEGLQYSHALTLAGNRATHVCFERQIHGFILMGRVIEEANAAVRMCAAQLRDALA